MGVSPPRRGTLVDIGKYIGKKMYHEKKLKNIYRKLNRNRKTVENERGNRETRNTDQRKENRKVGKKDAKSKSNSKKVTKILLEDSPRREVRKACSGSEL